jgi:hypothetical protein
MARANLDLSKLFGLGNWWIRPDAKRSFAIRRFKGILPLDPAPRRQAGSRLQGASAKPTRALLYSIRTTTMRRRDTSEPSTGPDCPPAIGPGYPRDLEGVGVLEGGQDIAENTTGVHQGEGSLPSPGSEDISQATQIPPPGTASRSQPSPSRGLTTL